MLVVRPNQALNGSLAEKTSNIKLKLPWINLTRKVVSKYCCKLLLEYCRTMLMLVPKENKNQLLVISIYPNQIHYELFDLLMGGLVNY